MVSEHEAILIREGVRITGVNVDKQTFSADKLVITAGAWSGQFAETLGLKQPIYPQRGQTMHLQGPVAGCIIFRFCL